MKKNIKRFYELPKKLREILIKRELEENEEVTTREDAKVSLSCFMWEWSENEDGTYKYEWY